MFANLLNFKYLKITIDREVRWSASFRSGDFPELLVVALDVVPMTNEDVELSCGIMHMKVHQHG